MNEHHQQAPGFISSSTVLLLHNSSRTTLQSAAPLAMQSSQRASHCSSPIHHSSRRSHAGHSDWLIRHPALIWRMHGQAAYATGAKLVGTMARHFNPGLEVEWIQIKTCDDQSSLAERAASSAPHTPVRVQGDKCQWARAG